MLQNTVPIYCTVYNTVAGSVADSNPAAAYLLVKSGFGLIRTFLVGSGSGPRGPDLGPKDPISTFLVSIL
jgi:hypothetical protein